MPLPLVAAFVCCCHGLPSSCSHAGCPRFRCAVGRGRWARHAARRQGSVEEGEGPARVEEVDGTVSPPAPCVEEGGRAVPLAAVEEGEGPARVEEGEDPASPPAPWDEEGGRAVPPGLRSPRGSRRGRAPPGSRRLTAQSVLPRRASKRVGAPCRLPLSRRGRAPPGSRRGRTRPVLQQRRLQLPPPHPPRQQRPRRGDDARRGRS